VGDREILEIYLNSSSKNTSETDIFRHGPKSLLASVTENTAGVPHLKIRKWPLEGLIKYSYQEKLIHLPYTPRTLYKLPNIRLLACREKLRGLSACHLYSSAEGRR